MSEKELDKGYVILQTHCIGAEVDGKKDCHSSDACTIYAHDPNEENDTEWYDASCFSCGQGFTRDQLYKTSLAVELGVDGGETSERKTFERKPKAEPMTKEEVRAYMAKYGYVSNNHRGVLDKYSQFYGHLTELGHNGKVISTKYPETKSGSPWPTGYKIKYEPKAWNKIGVTGISSQLSGQSKFPNGGKYLMIVGGELDKASGFQMLKEDQIRRKQGDYDPIAVVSPTTGEGSAAKQVALNYDFCDSFDIIVVGFDMDEAGQEANKAVAAILPKEKVRIAQYSLNDPNAMLQSGKEKQFVRDFYGAKEFMPNEIKHSSSALEEAREFLQSDKITLPPAFHRLQKNMRGGIKTSGAIINLIGDTSIGKCHSKGTEILMSDMTNKCVEEVVVGDLVMGTDGSPRKVQSLARGRDTMYRIEQGRGINYTVNSSHILSLRAGYDCKGSGVLKGDIVNLSVKEYISKGNKLKRSLKGYKGSLTKLGSNSAPQKHPWLLGLWLADGCATSPKISIADVDVEILEEVKKECNLHGYEIGYTSVKPNVKDYYIKGGFKDFLRSYNLIGNKHIPKEYLVANLRDRQDIMAGILDGDGFLVSNGFEIAQKSDDLAEGILRLGISLSLEISNKKVTKGCQNGFKGVYNRMHIFGQTQDIPNRLKRKKVEDRSELRGNINTLIKVVELEEDEYYGFNLDGDRLYCLSDGTATHNSLFTDALLYYWFYNSPLVPTIVSLERTTGELTVDFLSMHLKNNLSWFEDGGDALAVLDDPANADTIQDLLVNDRGESRYHVLDERSGSPDSLKACVERAVTQYGSRLIIFDPLTDFLRSLGTDAQEDFCMWEKQKKKEGIVFINVLHTRKPQPDKEGKIRKVTEHEILGSSSFAQSADANIVINRDKMAEEEVDRNTTCVDLNKIRGGTTGHACDIYYDYKTRSLHDKDDYFAEGGGDIVSNDF